MKIVKSARHSVRWSSLLIVLVVSSLLTNTLLGVMMQMNCSMQR